MDRKKVNKVKNMP